MSFTYPEYVLAVPDLAKSTAWWRDVMGFTLSFEVEGWSFLSRGEFALRLGECPDAIPPSQLGDHQFFAFVFVEDVDALHEEIVAKGATIQFPPRSQPWGNREMVVQTCDGHRFMVAQHLE